ncbi:MAG: FKBP-type peptidyl-prolyl cis-trans isomerase [Patescibacteria group bacterium]|mgnify:CR=1 FL=1
MATSKAVRGVSLFLAILFLVSTVVTVILIAKQSKDSETQSALQQQLVEQQAAQEACSVTENVTSSATPGDPLKLNGPVTELLITDTVVGTGEEVKLNDCITVNYRLNLSDGSVVSGNDTFASGSPIAFQLSEGGLIAGWIQGLPGMKVGGLRRLVVPSALAYGEQASASVPANSDLVFDIEVLDTKR